MLNAINYISNKGNFRMANKIWKMQHFSLFYNALLRKWDKIFKQYNEKSEWVARFWKNLRKFKEGILLRNMKHISGIYYTLKKIYNTKIYLLKESFNSLLSIFAFAAPYDFIIYLSLWQNNK